MWHNLTHVSVTLALRGWDPPSLVSQSKWQTLPQNKVESITGKHLPSDLHIYIQASTQHTHTIKIKKKSKAPWWIFLIDDWYEKAQLTVGKCYPCAGGPGYYKKVGCNRPWKKTVSSSLLLRGLCLQFPAQFEFLPWLPLTMDCDVELYSEINPCFCSQCFITVIKTKIGSRSGVLLW